MHSKHISDTDVLSRFSCAHFGEIAITDDCAPAEAEGAQIEKILYILGWSVVGGGLRDI